MSTINLGEIDGLGRVRCAWRPTGSPGSARQAAPAPSAGASGSATSGRRSACAGRIPRRRTAGIVGFSTQRAHRSSSDRSCMCLRIESPAISALAAADGRPCRNRPRRTAPRGSASWIARPSFRQRVVQVDDLVEPRLEEIILPAVPSFWAASNHPPPSRRRDQNHDQTPQSICKKSKLTAAAFLQIQ